MVPKELQDIRYFHYQLIIERPYLEALGTGSTFRELSRNALAGASIIIPPLDEQRAIANFLDRETARIDALIAKKQRLIELLQEKRTALISHTVIKGLDPDVPMRDSGVEWLGRVPAHWKAVRLRFVADIQTGLTLGQKYEDKMLVTRPYLRVANVQDGYLDLADITEIEVPLTTAQRYELRPGDVLMTEGGDFDKLGRGYVWDGQVTGCLHQNHVFAVRPSMSQLDPHFLAALMTSSHGKHYFTSTSQQTTNLATTNVSKLKQFPLFLPPIDEQRKILNSIHHQADRLDTLIGHVEDASRKLQEYRTALISAAVTGKIDVRGELP